MKKPTDKEANMPGISKTHPTDTRAARGVDGQWSGDIRQFLAWCAGAEDLDAYRAALGTVPPNAPWDAVSRSLRAGVEYREHPSEAGTRIQAPDVFLVAEPEGAEGRAAKRTILETEITRRAVRSGAR